MVKIKFGATVSPPRAYRGQPHTRRENIRNEARIAINFYLRSWYHWLSRLYFAPSSTDGIRRSMWGPLKYVALMAQMYSKGNVHRSRNRFTNRDCGINKAGQPRLDSMKKQEFSPHSSIRFWQYHIPSQFWQYHIPSQFWQYHIPSQFWQDHIPSQFWQDHIPAKLITFMDFFSDTEGIQINKINTILGFGDGVDPHFRLPYETNGTKKALYQHSTLLIYKQRYGQEINILSFVLLFIVLYCVVFCWVVLCECPCIISCVVIYKL
jgi:hypothetical protein